MASGQTKPPKKTKPAEGGEAPEEQDEAGQAEGPSAAEKAAARAQRKAAKKKKAEKDLPWTVILARSWTAIWKSFVDLLRALRSPDRATRRMALLFFLSFVTLSAVLAASWTRGLRDLVYGKDITAAGESGENLGRFLERQHETAMARVSTLQLGKFVVELAPPPPGTPGMNNPGVMNMAEIELAVECDSKTTCEFVETHQARARDMVTEAFLDIDRQTLLSREGKRRMKSEILKRLNFWLRKDGIRNVWFVRLIIS